MIARTLTRAELHALVWTSPPREVAQQLGITSAELDHLLELMAVPYPYSGYWSSKTHIPRRLPALPKSPPGAADSVEITPVKPARQAGSSRAARASHAEPNASESAAATGDAEDLAAPDPVPARPRSPHRIMAARLADEQRRRADWRRLGLGGRNTAETALERRTRLIEDLLYKAVERRGHKVEVEQNSLYRVRFVVSGQPITYAIRERYRQRREPLSREEGLEPWNVSMNRTHKQVRVMTGVLALTLDGGVWPKPQWEDKADKPLETQIEAIVIGLETVASAATAREEQRRANERRYHEEQQRREAARLRVLEEENRWRKFRELAGQAEEARQVRALLTFLEADLAAQPDQAAANELLAWARARLQSFDPLTRGAEGIVASLQAVTARSYSD